MQVWSRRTKGKLKKKRVRTEEEDEKEREEDEEEVHEEVNSSAPRLTQEEEYHFMPGLSQQHKEPFGPVREPESDPDIRPQVISEDLTKLKMRMNQKRASRNRVISFRGDHAGVSEPTDLSYSPTKLTWKEKKVVTTNQLERERENKVGKLKTNKVNGRSQI